MQDNQFENKLRDAISHTAPDVLDNILSNCKTQEGTTSEMKKSDNKRFIKSLCAIAAAFAIIVAGAFGIGSLKAGAVDAMVTLDVNPSIQLSINSKNEVVKAEALNSDAQTILNGLTLEGVELNTAVSAVIGSMLQNGYISELANSILITVDSSDGSRSASLEQSIVDNINKYFGSEGISGSVIAQVGSYDSSVQSLAQENNISVGKASLIASIMQQNPSYSFEELASLSINELNLIAQTYINHGTMTSVTTAGTASDKAYIGHDAALNAAVSAAGTTADNVTLTGTDMDYEHGRMVYEVEFIYNNLEYEYEIDATTGEVVDYKTESLDRDYNYNGQQNTSGNTSYITGDQALSAALSQIGANKSEITNLSVDFDVDDGLALYEVEFVFSGTEYEFDINAANGSVLGSKSESGHNYGTGQQGTSSDNSGSDYISRDQALSTALSHAGTSESQVTRVEVKFDMDDGKAVYEVDFTYGDFEYEYEINAVSNTVVKYERESIYD